MPRLSLALFCSYYKHWPKRYIEKEKGVLPKKVFGNRFGAPDINQYEIDPEEYDYDPEHRPWEFEAKLHQRDSEKARKKGYWWKNELSWDFKRKPVSKLTENDWCIFRGDYVEAMVGRDKGKQGVVVRTVRELDLCFVRGLNTKYVEIAPKGYAKQLVLKERPYNYVKEEVLLVDPDDLRPTTIQWKWNEQGERIRVSVRSGKEITIPAKELVTFEYKHPDSYKENSKDTRTEEVGKITFVLQLTTFEQDLIEEYKDVPGYEFLNDERKYRKSYWY